MMPMQLSSEQSLRPDFFFDWTAFLAVSSPPQWGQNLAQRGAGFLHFSQVSLGTGAPHSSQVSSMMAVVFLYMAGGGVRGAWREGRARAPGDAPAGLAAG
jgi:hypothetical protein